MENETLQYFVDKESNIVIIKMIDPMAESIVRVLSTIEHKNGETIKLYWDEKPKELNIQIINADRKFIANLIASIQGLKLIEGFEPINVAIPPMPEMQKETDPEELKAKLCSPDEYRDPGTGLTLVESVEKYGTISGAQFYYLALGLIRGRNRASLMARSAEIVREDLQKRDPASDSVKDMKNMIRCYSKIPRCSNMLKTILERTGTNLDFVYKMIERAEGDSELRVIYGAFIVLLKRAFRTL